MCTSCDLDNRVIISKQTIKQQSFNNLMSVIQIPSYKCACFTIIYADFKTQLHVIFCCIICNTGKNSISNKHIFIPHVPYQWLKHKLPFKCDLSIFLEIKLNISTSRSVKVLICEILVTYFIRLAVLKTRQRGIRISHLIKVVIFCALYIEKKINVWKY